MSDHLITPGRKLGRYRTCDVAFTFRAGAGFSGDVNRGHPASIQPCQILSTSPPLFYGSAVLVDSATSAVRAIATGDSAITTIWGVTVRPFPMNQSTSTNFFAASPFGSIAPQTLQPIDIIRAGYVLVSVNGSPAKGGTVYLYYGTSTGAHVQSGFEAATGANIATLDERYSWNSPADSSGIAELSITL